MESNKKYWLWLSLQCRANSRRMKKVIQRFRTPENAYNATEAELMDISDISAAAFGNLADKSLERAGKVMADMQKMGVEIVTYDDYNYPPRLRNIEYPPYVLYTRGSMDWHSIKPMTVVGTRECTEYGVYATTVLCTSLVKYGFTIVSGMASGIDTAASRAALEANGKTVIVLGSGIDVVYPAENVDLYNKAIENGIVITEFPPGTPPYGGNFPQRNRIMSALGDGVLVTEAPKRSGALITASHAIEDGKSVFAVPGPIFKKAYEGTNDLIQQGAKLVTSIRDIMEDYIFDRAELRQIMPEPCDDIPLKKSEYMDVENEEKEDKSEKKSRKKKKEPEKVAEPVMISIDDERFADLDEDEKKVIELLIEKEYGADEMCRILDIKINVLNNILIWLEMQGLISKLAGNSYKINE